MSYNKENWQQRYVTIKGRTQALYNNAQTRAKKHGLGFDLDRPWIAERLEAGRCEVTGLPFSISVGDKQAPRSFAPSLDRKDPEKGYTKVNSQLVCWIYNAAKHTATHEDVVAMAQALCARMLP